MTTRRKGLLLAVPVLLLPLTGVLRMGSVEVLIWVGLVLAWLALFAVWGGRSSRSTLSR